MTIDAESYEVQGKVEVFPQKDGWTYVRLPEEYTHRTRGYADRGLVAVTVTLGSSRWETSLLPMGDGTLFIPLKAQVRKRENIGPGDRVTIRFSVRQR